ncbi:hypothetical protein AB205_0078800 [Aquarana catesbeiana]|uniref:Uncharacterized protein n=1 Tax=Aquarana catesbeiana TaxID=8400 RepID=A0A2G9RTX8_AQUCT|nr:hypothetical protein AB205_0078800 [Aquarana catesbeiana]
MNTLGEQHADKAFTIQGAPSDSGPLRIAKTPSPPEEVSQIPSPLASPNHTLAPASPAPARPKSPSQYRMVLGAEDLGTQEGSIQTTGYAHKVSVRVTGRVSLRVTGFVNVKEALG